MFLARESTSLNHSGFESISCRWSKLFEDLCTIADSTTEIGGTVLGTVTKRME